MNQYSQKFKKIHACAGQKNGLNTTNGEVEVLKGPLFVKRDQKGVVMMKVNTTIVVMGLALTLGIAGCKKDQKPAATAADESGQMAQDSSALLEQSATQVAEGKMRELLLSLQRVHFPLDSDTLVDDAREALDSAAVQLNEHGDIELFVDGHTDERGTTEHNMALANRRANAVVDYLARLGVPQERLHVVSHGEEAPLVGGENQVAYAKNRRVDFRVMKGSIQLVLEEGTLVNDQGDPIVEPDEAADEPAEE